MFNNVIVGVDGREGGRDAIALARRLRADDGELTLAYVYRGESHPWRGSSPSYEAVEDRRAWDKLEKARAEAGIEARIRWRGSSSVGRGLHELTESIGADLLVIGSSRRGLLGRVLVGDDTRAALNGAPCAVAIAPAGYVEYPTPIREIGVGYDGSPESEHALGVARRLAGLHDTTLSAFEAIAFPTHVYVGWGLPGESVIDQKIDAARDRIAALGDVEPHAAYGVPAEELALYSASLDLLVVGSRGYGPAGRLVHGSTSHQLARTARCPLLVLTRAARSADTGTASSKEREGTMASAAT